jgi:hypothetical protein
MAVEFVIQTTPVFFLVKHISPPVFSNTSGFWQEKKNLKV